MKTLGAPFWKTYQSEARPSHLESLQAFDWFQKSIGIANTLICIPAGLRVHMTWRNLFTLYVHPGINYSYPTSSLFHGAAIEEREKVEWGQWSVVRSMAPVLWEALTIALFCGLFEYKSVSFNFLGANEIRQRPCRCKQSAT